MDKPLIARFWRLRAARQRGRLGPELGHAGSGPQSETCAFSAPWTGRARRAEPAPLAPDPETQKGPHAYAWGPFRIKDCPAVTYSPTPSPVQYHRR